MNLRLMTETPRVEIHFQCEECGTILKVPTSYNLPEPDYLICSRCWAASNWAYRQEKMRERHSPDWGAKLPPMIHIDTRDMPGFVRDDLARKIGQTLSLFKAT